MSEFWIFFFAGVFTGWPPAIAGMILTWKLATRKVLQTTDQQTQVIQDMANEQTGQLLGILPLPEAYKGHEQRGDPSGPAG